MGTREKVIIGIIIAAAVGGSLYAFKPWKELGPGVEGGIAPVLKLTRPDGVVEITHPASVPQAVLWKDKPFRNIEMAWDITATVDGQSGTVEFQRPSYIQWRQRHPAGGVTGRKRFEGDKSSLGSTYRTPWSPLGVGYFRRRSPGTYRMRGVVTVDLKATTDAGKVYDTPTKSAHVEIIVKVTQTPTYELSVTIRPSGPKRLT